MWLYKYYSNVTFDEKILTNGVRGAIMQFVNEVVSRKQTHTKIIKVLNLKGGNIEMKKFISLALAASMALSLVPVTAFASTDNRISNVVTVEKEDVLGTDVKGSIPEVVIVNDKGDIKDNGDFSFELQLDGAEWDTIGDVEVYEADANNFMVDSSSDNSTNLNDGSKVKVEKISSTKALFTVDVKSGSDPDTSAGLRIVLKGVKVTGDTAKVTINPKNSTLSADTFTFAKAADGATITTVDGTKDFYDGGDVKDIFIEEVTTGTLEHGKKVTLKLNSGFKFPTTGVKVSVVSGDGGIQVATDNKGTGAGVKDVAVAPSKDDSRTIEFYIWDNTSPNGGVTQGQSAIIKVSGISINEDGADFGKVAEITVNGDNVDKTTLEMGKYVDFGVSVTAADKDLPIIYSGTVLSDDDKYVTLPVTIKENVADSWLLDTRKTTFKFPEGVDVVKVEVADSSEFSTADSSIEAALNNGIDNNEITLDKGAIDKNANKKAELELKFYLTVDAEYTGDITCTVGGPAISEEAKVTVAKAVSPIAIEAEKKSVAIDYRNVNVGDITVKEAEAGLWAKKDTITLKVDNMQFESGIKAEVVEGDGEIEDLSVNKSEGTIKLTVKSESSKTPMSIKLSNVSLYLNRSLPAGDYSLSVVGSGADEKPVETTDVMFKNYDSDNDKDEKFDTKSVEFVKDYVTVATSGRDQGTTFTTEVAVTIDSTTMRVDGKEKTLDVPAYLSAEGWTMLPVRAVTEALATASNSQPIDWIAGNPGTIMIYYGDKTVAMTLGSTTMYINGTPVPMSTAPVIVNDRAFLPMRDLGRALGLSDDQIKWDATTRTATFNPAATTTTK